ncbi:MAG TPA: protein kinase [Polyangiales bacterium]|nr:protein kinase [Polyangiales bacterium]
MDRALVRPAAGLANDESGGHPRGLSAQDPSLVAGRYEVLSLLGRGGMASAYRVRDTATGRELALKLLTVARDAPAAARTIELFEGEFHTLNQLAHPRVVRAFDYGVADGQPYYTMEILDGGDLHELAPLPWQEVCQIAYEICSVLSLLHSRRLVHRDLTPRNVRRTADGTAKLIDFGLLAPMGPTGLIAGTPPYVAPELVQRMSLDGRSDLFSLGATLYHALTGRTAFPARRFDQLTDLWRSSPLPPSRVVPGIPAPVDELVLGLLRIDLGSRPKSATEVMDRLLPLLAAAPAAELSSARAFLTAPQLVGRDDVVIKFRKQMAHTLRSHGNGFLLSGVHGSGRSRMLDTFVLEAKLVGAITARAGAADAATGAFGVASALAAQLCAAMPALSLEVAKQDPHVYAILFDADALDRTAEAVAGTPANHNAGPLADVRMRDLSAGGVDRAVVHLALRSWLLGVARRKPIALAVDDIDRIDEASAAWFASLAWEAPEHRLVYAVTVTQAVPGAGPDGVAGLSVLREHATEIELRALRADEITRLLSSVFGEVPNLQAVSTALHAISGGRPKDCMSLAQSLVDQGAIASVGGTWVLPSSISAGLLPSGLEEALERSIAALTPLARRVLLTLSLDVRGRLNRATLRRLDEIDPRALDTALDELRAAEMITGNVANYSLCHGAIARVAIAAASPTDQASSHRELARLHEQMEDHVVASAFHWLHTDTPELGLDALLARARDADGRTELGAGGTKAIGSLATARTFERALEVAERLARPRRDLQAVWVMLAAMTARGEDRRFWQRVPKTWLEQLRRDSGYDDFRSLDPSLDALARLSTAFTTASERHNATPEAERVLAPIDAIKQLVAYVVCGIAVSVQGLDCEMQASLPELLVPFAALSPLVKAMLCNARGTQLNGDGQHEAARAAFIEALAAFETVPVTEMRYVASVRASIMQTVAEIDAFFGVRTSYTARLEEADQDPNQAVGAQYIRKVLAMQEGDWEAAERHRQSAELLLLQGGDKPMFSTLGYELEAHALARDLTGVKHVQTAVRAQAEKYPGWIPVMHIADAHFARLCGDLAGALQHVETARAHASAGEARSRWALVARVLEVELLTELGQASAALERGLCMLAECEREGMRSYVRSLSGALALAEVQLGDAAGALRRIEAVIVEQKSLTISGLLLGRSYEYAARVGIQSRNVELLQMYSNLAAEQYRAGQTSVLGALYERLLEDARAAGLIDAAAVDAHSRAEALLAASSWSRVSTAMAGCEDSAERAQRALGVLCNGKVLNRGHLFLVTRDGLTLVASNTPCEQSRELTLFARSYLQTEIEAVDLTQTSGDFDITLDTDARPGTWQDQAGTPYVALFMRADVEGRSRVVGIAMLTGLEDADRLALLPLSAALSKKLVESGDCSAA